MLVFVNLRKTTGVLGKRAEKVYFKPMFGGSGVEGNHNRSMAGLLRVKVGKFHYRQGKVKV